jgi:hypothetical protein
VRYVFIAVLAVLTVLLGCAQGVGPSALPSTDAATGDVGVRGDGGGPGEAAPADAMTSDDAALADGPYPDASGDAGAQTDGAVDTAPQRDGQKDTAPQQDGQQDAAPQQDGQQDTAPQQDAEDDGPPGCTTQDLLVNGNFDQGEAVGWTRYSSWGLSGDPVIYASGSLAHGSQGGGYAAWMGGKTSGENRLSQAVTVPANATSLRLTGYIRIDTVEIGGDYDDLFIKLLLDSDQSVLETLVTYANGTTNTPWTAFTLPAADPHAGQTIDLLLDATNDLSRVTSFYVDTLALEAVVCP